MKKQTKKHIEPELSREQILDVATAAGNKLGALLAVAPLSESTKEAILTILESASPKQIDRLTELLEEQYLKAQITDFENVFIHELERIKTETEFDRRNLNNKTLDALHQLESRITK